MEYSQQTTRDAQITDSKILNVRSVRTFWYGAISFQLAYYHRRKIMLTLISPTSLIRRNIIFITQLIYVPTIAANILNKEVFPLPSGVLDTWIIQFVFWIQIISRSQRIYQSHSGGFFYPLHLGPAHETRILFLVISNSLFQNSLLNTPYFVIYR